MGGFRFSVPGFRFSVGEALRGVWFPVPGFRFSVGEALGAFDSRFLVLGFLWALRMGSGRRTAFG